MPGIKVHVNKSVVPSTGFSRFKYVNTTYSIFGVLEESLMLPAFRNTYQAVADVVLKSSNTKLILKGVGADVHGETSVLRDHEDLQFFIYLFNLEEFHENQFWFPTPIFMLSDLLLISCAPPKFPKYSTDFISFDTPVLIMLVLSMTIVPLLMVVATDPKTLIRKIKTFLKRLWDTFFLFFLEPYQISLTNISWRITVGSWLIIVTFISIYVSCIFKSDAYEESYVKINSLEDWFKYSPRQMVLQYSSDSLRYFKAWEQKLDRKVSKERVSERNLIETAEPYFFQEIGSGLNDYLISEVFLDIYLDISVIMMDTKPILFISEKPLTTFKYVFAARKELKAIPWVVESIELIAQTIFETKCFENMFQSTTYNKEPMRWKEPEKTVSAVTLAQSLAAFKIYGYGILLDMAVFFLEIIIFHIFK